VALTSHTAQVPELHAQHLLPAPGPTTVNVADDVTTAAAPTPACVAHAPIDIVPDPAQGDIVLGLGLSPIPVNVGVRDLGRIVDALQNVSDGAGMKIQLF